MELCVNVLGVRTVRRMYIQGACLWWALLTLPWLELCSLALIEGLNHLEVQDRGGFTPTTITAGKRFILRSLTHTTDHCSVLALVSYTKPYMTCYPNYKYIKYVYFVNINAGAKIIWLTQKIIIHNLNNEILIFAKSNNMLVFIWHNLQNMPSRINIIAK